MKPLTNISIVSLILLTGCIPDVYNTKPEVRGLAGAAPVQTLFEPTTNAQATLRPGGKLVVELQSNPTTGYYWSQTSGETGVLAFLTDDYVADPAPEGVVGSGGRQVITFEAVAPGRTTLVLSYQRSPQDVAETRSIKIKVIE